MDARLCLLNTIYEILRPLNLWDEYNKPGWSDRQFVRDCVLRLKRGEQGAWSDFLERLESDRALAISVLRLLVDHEVLVAAGAEEEGVVDEVSDIAIGVDELLRGPKIDDFSFRLPGTVAPLSDNDEVRLREMLDIERQPNKMLVADSLAGALPNRADLYGFEHEKRFLPATKKCVGEIMYIEKKPGGALTGHARIGRVRFSQSRETIYYDGMKLQSLKGSGGKANFFDVEFGTWYWISKCRKDGVDTLYPGGVEIDEDVREEYWTEIRRQPENKDKASFRSPGKYSKRRPC